MAGSILGNAVKRTEDPRFLRGEGRYVDDLDVPGSLYAVFVRATVAHARILDIDTSEAKAMPGVVGVWTADDIGLSAPRGGRMVPEAMAHPPLASGKVRFVGEAIAVVAAETRAQAMDAAEMVIVDYDPLPAVTDPIEALADGAPVLFEDHGSNLATELNLGGADKPLEDAEVVVKGRFVNQRVIPVPMESNGIVAAPDTESGGLTVWVSTQGAHGAQRALARPLGLEADQVHVIVPAVGGGFGAKGGVASEHQVICKLALQLGKPVRHFETRSENMVAMTHGRAQVQDVELGLRRDGTITGLNIVVTADAGAYPGAGAFLPFLTRLMASGTYRIPKIAYLARVAVTSTTPIGAYRGAGRPEAAALVERIIDMAAAELDIDPAEIRRRNFIPPDAFPYQTVTGANYDTGDYDLTLTEALRIAGYDDLRADQRARRERDDRMLLGIGVASYVETTGGGQEFGSVEVAADGTVTVLTGTSPHGQGHETAWAQIAAEVLGVPLESVRVVFGDTRLVRSGGGTMGSRSAQLGGSAVHNAAEGVLEKAKTLAAHLLEASADDIVVHDGGKLGVAGVPASALSWTALAEAASDQSKLPEGMDPGLSHDLDFQAGGSTFPFGTHVSVVEVDTETGSVHVLRHIAVDDAGRILNPMLVQGQQHGGIAQGMAQALYEGVAYDTDGNPLTATLATYAMPTAAEFPPFEAHNTQTPTSLNPLGAKGIGESATIGSTPAVQNAVVDALAHLGVRHLDMPLTPERVWRAIQDARGTGG